MPLAKNTRTNTQEPRSTTRTPIPELTGLRTIAAGLVFVGHVLEPHAAWTPLFVQFGWVGVNIFFALSGFLFTKLYMEELEQGTFSYRTYIVKRIIRIYPVTTLVLAASIIGAGGVYWVDAIAHFTLVHGWFPQFRSTINAPMWTLTVEESFYLVAPVGIFLAAGLSRMWTRYTVRRDHKLIWWQFAALLIVLWVFSFALSRGLVLHYLETRLFLVNTWDNGAYTFTFLGRLSDFVAGMLAAVAMRHTVSVKQKATTISLVLGIALLFACMVFIDSVGGPVLMARHKMGIVAGHLIALASAFIIIGVQGRNPAQWLLSRRWMVLLGNASFSLYLIHFMPLPGMPQLSLSIQMWLETTGLHPVAAWALNYAALNVIAIGIFLLFERPTSRYLRKRAFR
ncbi:MAG TPA: acyltransferase [Candidatus Didemnitutus sp.]|nr:acyltransferase [Candidatus Didemnitutus sp.]